jgi:hypothetical protein
MDFRHNYRVRACQFGQSRTQKLPKSAGNGFPWFAGFGISHFAVPADVFAAVALDGGHNLDHSRYP